MSYGNPTELCFCAEPETVVMAEGTDVEFEQCAECEGLVRAVEELSLRRRFEYYNGRLRRGEDLTDEEVEQLVEDAELAKTVINDLFDVMVEFAKLVDREMYERIEPLGQLAREREER